MIITENDRNAMRSPAARLVEALGKARTAREYGATFEDYLALHPYRHRALRIGPSFAACPGHLRVDLLARAPKVYDRLARASGCWS